ncbi:MAG: hypothetical protein ACLQL2_11580 [Methylovirgula sp.]
MSQKSKLLASVVVMTLAAAATCSAQTVPNVTQQSADVIFGTHIDTRAVHALDTQSGLWKAVVPPTKMPGAFDDHDPIGLAAGKMIHADCSINWTDPDTHKLYCFTSATSLVYFLSAPHANLARANKGWLKFTGS